ncbi:MAG: DNA polymerase III subunit delta [Acidimicrobiales bacterium]
MSAVYVLTGGDEILLSAARTDLVTELVGDGDPTMMVAELAGDDYEMHQLVDAAQTPPFLTDRRVVVGRGMGRFVKDDHALLLSYLADPLDTTVLVLEWAGGRVPKPVTEAVKQAGGEIRSTGPGRKIGDWAAQQLTDAGIRPDRAGTNLIVDWLGDDAGKLPGLIAVLDSTYGEGARLTADDIEPFLFDAGGVPPWDLTDAIDRGDIAASITALTRMLGAGRHPLQVMATLHTHFQRILRLDGAAVRGEKDAAVVLGLKGSTFPAKKALAQARKLGPRNARSSIALLHRADVDLRGTVDWPDHLVLEVLVARLARVARAAR